MCNPIQKVLEQLNRENAVDGTNPRDEKLTIEKLAQMLGVTKQTLLNWKDDSSKIPAGKLVELSTISGISLDKLMEDDEKKIFGPVLEETYEPSISRLKEVIKSVEIELDKLKSLQFVTSDNALSSAVEEIQHKAIDQVKNVINSVQLSTRKKRVCAIGHSDTGKSTLANFLLGEKIALTSYTPTTSTIVYFHHIDDKPKYLENLQNAVVFGRKLIDGKPEGKIQPFDDYLSEKTILEKGDYESVLKAYGTRAGAYFNNDEFCIDTIHIFIDNPFLKEVDYIDVPGFGSGSEMDEISLTQKLYQSDILFYLSTADAFFRGNELSLLSKMLNSHCVASKSVDSIYILATHANSVGDPETLNKLVDSGIERLVQCMTEQQLNNIEIFKNDFSALRNRCFMFEPQNEKFCTVLSKAIEEGIPKLIEESTNKSLDQLRIVSKDIKKCYEKKLETIYKDIEEKEIPKDEKIKDHKKNTENKINELKEKLHLSIENSKKHNIVTFKRGYDKIANEDYIIDKLEKNEVKNKKDEINDFVTLLCNEIDEEFSNSIKDASGKFSDEVNKSIEEYSELWKEIEVESKINISMGGFDFTRAFASGLVGVSVYGALAFWASVVAAGSNLGAYILIAKVASVLAALGISFGGSAALISAVSAIGGPVVLGIAIALISAISMWGILSGTWRKRVAKKVIKAFNEESVYEKCNSKIDEYWDDTIEAVDKCLSAMHNETIKVFEDKINIRKSSDKDKIKKFLTKVYKYVIEMFGVLADV